MRKYLESVGGAAWLDRVEAAGQPAAETLAEFAGRMCYRSWAPGLNANVKKVRQDSDAYIANIVHSLHGSVLEHASFTFVFQDVSRVFTHELVRHRAGVAVSQESLRYVRLTDQGFRIPQVLKDPEDYPACGATEEGSTALVCDRPAGHPSRWHGQGRGFDGVEWTGEPSVVPDGVRPALQERIVHIVEELEEFQRETAAAFGLDDDGVPFHVKKEVTSALRRLAPIGLSTTIVWTANLRTLRHVIEMRTAAGAEEEIRLVFDQVAAMMKAECPAVFADFEREHDGTWVSQDRKV
jgi:thymidylate synthase (FAD)